MSYFSGFKPNINTHPLRCYCPECKVDAEIQAHGVNDYLDEIAVQKSAPVMPTVYIVAITLIVAIGASHVYFNTLG